MDFRRFQRPYLLVLNNLRSWTTARSKCEAVGQNLVRIDSAAENDIPSHAAESRLVDQRLDWREPTPRPKVLGAGASTTLGSGRARRPRAGVPFPGMFNKWGFLSAGQLPQSGLRQDSRSTASGPTKAAPASTSTSARPGARPCPNDPQKVEFGVCGCGVADVDTDADGKLDCQEQCPLDPTKLVPGHCGCSNAPKPAGTVCRDGLCDANTQCNGAGVRGAPAVRTPPDSLCHSFVQRNTYYWFCNNDRQFSDARQRCQAAGTDLIAVDDAFEDSLFATHTLEYMFLGATDEAVEGDWVWLGRPMPFWTGGVSGSPVAGAYANWHVGQPAVGLPPGDSWCGTRRSSAVSGKRDPATPSTLSPASANHRRPFQTRSTWSRPAPPSGRSGQELRGPGSDHAKPPLPAWP